MDPNAWIFTKEQIENSPSRKCGITLIEEKKRRQSTANFIFALGSKLLLKSESILIGMTYMHRYYMIHSLKVLSEIELALACIFLTLKSHTGVSYVNRNAVHIIKTLESYSNQIFTDANIEQLVTDLLVHESFLLQTLGFQLNVVLPHYYILNTRDRIIESKALTIASCMMASFSIRKTIMCVRHSAKISACICIYAASIVTGQEIPHSPQGIHWFLIIDDNFSVERVEKLSEEFLPVLLNFKTQP